MRLRLSTALALPFAALAFAVPGSGTVQAQIHADPQVFPDPRFQLNLDGGWSRRSGEVMETATPEQKQYMEDMRNGWEYGGDAVYYFGLIHGVGFAYNHFFASNSDKDMQFVDSATGTVLTGVSDNVGLMFIGPLYALRAPFLGGRFDFQARFALGYLGYKDKGSLGGLKADIAAGTFGVMWALGLDSRLSSNFGLGMAFKMISGGTKEIEVNGTRQTLAEKEGLGHINLAAGLRFYL